MRDHTMTTGSTADSPASTPAGLVCHWVAVTDDTGRTHMEARWEAPQVVAGHPHAA